MGHPGKKRFLKPEEIDIKWHKYIDFSMQELGTRSGNPNSSTLYVYSDCPMCGSTDWKRVSNLRAGGSPHCGSCARKRHRNRGENHANWIGGVLKDSNGYRKIHSTLIPKEDWWLVSNGMHAGGRYILEHRYVAAKKYNRPITSDEVVRHINGIKDDNRPENLIVGTHAENQMDHNSARISTIYYRSLCDLYESTLSGMGIDIEKVKKEHGF